MLTIRQLLEPSESHNHLNLGLITLDATAKGELLLHTLGSVGAISQGDSFRYLRQHPNVFRFFEFSLGDGGLVCS